MAVSIEVNGTALSPQPRTANWTLNSGGGVLDGTDHLGAYDTLILRSPPARGGTANWNWNTFENQTLTSVQAFPRGETMKTGTETLYNAGVVSKPITTIMSSPGDIIDSVELMVWVIT